MLLADNFATYLPKIYPYDIVGGQRQVFAADFDNRIDIIPVADPNIFSQTQRITVAQTELQMALSNPDIHNVYHAYRHMYEALGVKDVDILLPPPKPIQAMDPASENIMALNNKKFQAFPKQDHQAHMKSHLSFMGTMMVRNNPKALARLQMNCMEHINLMAAEQVQMEFVDEMQEMQQIQLQMQAMIQNMGPMAQQNPQFLQFQLKLESTQVAIEARKSNLIAEFTEDYAQAEKQVLNQIENDPVLKLKDRDLDLKAREEQRKEEEGQQKANMDMMKLMQNKDLAEDKLEQDDNHAKLRASVSLAKQGINQMKAVVKETS
jgi:hypothetical protein